MWIIASNCHTVLAASSAAVCATIGAGEEHTKVSATAETNLEDGRCMIRPLPYFVINDPFGFAARTPRATPRSRWAMHYPERRRSRIFRDSVALSEINSA
jgi:hypothetical protein